MNISSWIDFFQKYSTQFPKEKETCDKFIAFAKSQDHLFERSNTFGHFTASALIFDPKDKKILLTHHRKLNKWLQLGGHADGDSDLSHVAYKEAQEESGLNSFEFFPAPAEPIDIDVHEIPKNPKDDAHFHFDVRYVLLGDSTLPLGISDESNDLKWFKIEDAKKIISEESLLRLIEKLVLKYEKSGGDYQSKTH